jgi:glycosyltransferase involved in cell wall biosynthesis
MRSSVYFLVSSLKNESPVKALVSLANNLDVNYFKVNVVILFDDLSLFNRFDDHVNLINLSSGTLINKLLRLKFILENDKHSKLSISYGIIGDFLNFLSRSHFNNTISNIRGTLYELYILKYGKFIGNIILYLHNSLIKNSDYIFVLNSNLLTYYKLRSIGKNHVIFNNFIDYDKYPVIPLNNKYNEVIKFVFLASLTKEKGFFLLMDIFNRLYNRGKLFHLYIIGCNTNKDVSIDHFVSTKLPKSCFSLLGYLDEPFKYVVESNYLIHPSYSEGTPRSALEALNYNIPVIIRDSVSNGLIQNEINGFVFKDDDDLYNLLLHILDNNLLLTENICVPLDFTKDFNVNQINNFLKKLNEK